MSLWTPLLSSLCAPLGALMPPLSPLHLSLLSPCLLPLQIPLFIPLCPLHSLTLLLAPIFSPPCPSTPLHSLYTSLLLSMLLCAPLLLHAPMLPSAPPLHAHLYVPLCPICAPPHPCVPLYPSFVPLYPSMHPMLLSTHHSVYLHTLLLNTEGHTDLGTNGMEGIKGHRGVRRGMDGHRTYRLTWSLGLFGPLGP